MWYRDAILKLDKLVMEGWLGTNARAQNVDDQNQTQSGKEHNACKGMTGSEHIGWSDGGTHNE
jgi:hypothetical protein